MWMRVRITHWEQKKNNMKQTAVEWLIAQVNSEQYQIAFGQTYISIDLIEQAKQMEKEQIMKTARECHFEGVRQSAKTSEDYIAYGEQYYNETYKPNNK